jgi:hypothetical protein
MHRTGSPVLLHDVIGDLGAVVELLAGNAPYHPLGGWFRPGSDQNSPTYPLWFQKDWVHASTVVPGAELFLRHARVIEAAQQFYSAEVIVAHTVYVNLMGPTAAPGPAHTDNPVFRGLDRTNTPMHMLRAMVWSGLFDRWVITQATSIWWMNDVSGGGLLYWPDGPGEPPARHEGHMANTALVGDNHGMFHQVMPIGGTGGAPILVTARAELGPASHGDWAVVDHGREVWRAPLERIRVSVLWKAHVFENQAEQERLAPDTIGHSDVVRIFNDDLARRGEPLRLEPAGIADPQLSDDLRRVYPEPTPVGAGVGG